MSQSEASRILDVSVRQIKRLLKAYLELTRFGGGW
jgi:hypothetical protein